MRLPSEQKLIVNGVEYILVQEYKVISENPPISEGPFYSQAGLENDKYLFMPDLAYLMEIIDTPQYMHRIQVK